jgi:hypothetical protein
MPQPKEKAEVRHIGLVKAEKPDLSKIVDEDGGYFPAFNGVSDELIRALKLSAYEQAVLWRLIRLSHGWKRVTCTVGYAKLVEFTNISRNEIRRTLGSLIEKGLLEDMGTTPAGTTYRVLPGLGVPRQGSTQQGTPYQGTGGAGQGTRKPAPVPRQRPNKDKEKESLKDTAVCSRCSGTGVWYPQGFDKGVARCNHKL